MKHFVFLLCFALPNTVLSFGILFLINMVISGVNDFDKSYLGWIFLIIIVFTYLLNIIFQKKLNQYSYHVLYENEKDIFQKLLKTRLVTLEKYGTQRFYTAIEDLRIFSSLPEVITHTINSLLMLLLCVVYMFSLSVYAGLIILSMVVLIAIFYFVVMLTMNRKVHMLRKFNEDYYSYVNDVIKGFKNLKVNSILTNNLLEKELIPNRDLAKELDYKINYVFLSINLISQYGLYLIIGIILFVLPAFELLPRTDVISYVVIILFISGPINNLINMQNVYTKFVVANKRINAFIKDFSDESIECIENSDMIDFESLRFENVSFQYDCTCSEQSFALNKINLNIKKGEVIFIIGGNGSGKSTFINVLTGLYDCTEGVISLNKKPLESKSNLQQLISPVFTDNYIFSRNYDNYLLENNHQYQYLLKMMEMHQVVNTTIDEAVRGNFSKGQSKRMSLVFALLENKPVLVLDEWAADQDPYFRKYFYEVLIPKLKNEGKTIIAVTHDDSYFKQADRVIKFDYGKINKDVRISHDFNFSML